MSVSIPQLLFMIVVVGGLFGAIYFVISKFANSPIEKAIDELQKETKYKDIMKESVTTDEKFFASVAYVGPFFIFTLILKQESAFCRYHTKQAIALFFVFIFLSFLYYFLAFLLPDFIVIIFRIAFAFFLFGLMMMGIFNATLGEKKPLPIISNYIDLT